MHTINFAGVIMKNPVVVASSPLTSKLKWLMEADRAGAAAVSTKLTFIKQPFYGKLRMHTTNRLGSLICYDRRLDEHEGLRLVEEAKAKTSLRIFANITHDNEDMEGWITLARAFENAGADLIEANLICPNVGLSTQSIKGNDSLALGEFGGAISGQNPHKIRQIIKALKESVKIPVVAKLTPNVTDIALMALAAKEAGVDGICLAGGQSALPPVNIYDRGKPQYPLMNGVAHGSLGGPACRFMSFSQIAQVVQKTDLPVIGGGGLNTAEECLQMMMWGASMVTLCTSVMWYGWEVIEKAVNGIEAFLTSQQTTYKEITGLSLPYLRSSSNLEALSGFPVVDESKCTGCGACAKPGHCDAIEMVNKKPVIQKEKCLGCGICLGVCPVKALTMLS